MFVPRPNDKLRGEFCIQNPANLMQPSFGPIGCGLERCEVLHRGAVRASCHIDRVLDGAVKLNAQVDQAFNILDACDCGDLI